MTHDVELHEIRVFLVLCDELHFGRTAERVGLTQSRVSQLVRRLERRLGTRLADRTSRRVALTPDGERFRDEVAVALDALDEVVRRTRASRRRLAETVRVGVVSAAAVVPHLRSVAAAFEDRHPGSTVEFVGLPFDDRLGPLRRGEVDVVVTHLPLDQPDLVTGPVLARQSFVLATSRHDALAPRSTVHVGELAGRTVGQLDLDAPRELLDVLELRDAEVAVERRRVVVRQPADLVLAIALGQVVQPVTATFARTHQHPDVVYVPLEGMPDAVSVLASRRHDPSPEAAALLECARDVPLVTGD